MRKFAKGFLLLVLVLVVFTGAGLSFYNLLYPFKYQDLISKYAQSYNLDEGLVASIIFCESRFNKNAKSNKGALGLMQIMPSTAAGFYKEERSFSSEMLFDPEFNIQIGSTFLRYLFDKYQDEVVVLACYNAGETAVRLWMGNNKSLEKTQIKYKETLNYVEKVQKFKPFYKKRF